MAARLRLSVIIPVGPGERAWHTLLDDLAVLPREVAEILLVAMPADVPAAFTPQDHGLQAAARWLTSSPGRARQQNAGAVAARGEVLWFLHADSRLPPVTVETALRFAGRPALGYFRLRFAGDGPRLARLNALGAGIRSRWLGLPFGDQGLILPRRLFERLGHFDESLAAGEDHALVWAARRAGIPLAALPAPVTTSARRYAEQGWLRTTLRHARLTISQARRFSGSR